MLPLAQGWLNPVPTWHARQWQHLPPHLSEHAGGAQAAPELSVHGI